jgi:RNA polymerase sigma-70 factor (ECF subfamily)
MTSTPDPDTVLQEFDRHRRLLFALAYRMLGGVMDAEDIVQEAFLRWQQAPVDQIESPKAYLLTIVTRLCIDELRSARSRRETYIGPWLPEPLLQTEALDPGATLDLADSLSFAFLLLLERLTPLERAVFILHDIFEYTYDEVGRMVGSNGPHCRQLGHRARARISAGRPRFAAAPAQVQQVTQQFIRACSDGDLEGLLSLFAAEITLASDGGGKVSAARNVIIGGERVARFLVGIMRKVAAPLSFQTAHVNGQLGILVWRAGQLNRIYSLDVDASARIRAIYCVLNPDKLHSWRASDP